MTLGGRKMDRKFSDVGENKKIDEDLLKDD